MIFKGKMSIFGGKYDDVMQNDSGLALYEAKEADLRPDLFDKSPEDDIEQPTWKRLRISSYYVAYRFDHDRPRWRLQQTPVRVVNPKNNKLVMAWLVDWGPAEDTGRVLDVSPGVASALELTTDDIVSVEHEI